MANSVAYDLSRFEDRPKAVVLEKVEKGVNLQWEVRHLD